MIPRLIFSMSVAILVSFAIVPAQATSNYEYGKDEYAIISGGLAPNRQVSLASHGGGELGDVNFRLFLMAEPAHRRLMALPGIGSGNNLDTAPAAYHAVWSQDARHVAVTFRTNRHEIGLKLYSIEGGRAHPIGGPNLFKEVTSRDVADGDDLRQRISGVEWRRGNRFVLREHLSFVVSDPAFPRLLGSYGRVAEKLDGGKMYMRFAAEAHCLIEANHRYRVMAIEPANPDAPPEW